MSNAIDTIQNDSFALAVWRSFKAGFVCSGIDVYRQLRTTGTIDWGEAFETFFVSAGAGVVFGGSAILAASLKSAAIYTALGASCFTFFGVSLAQADGEAGYYDLMFLDVVFSSLSLEGSKSCFDNAYNVSTASNTAKSSTNTSTQNTNTAKSFNNSPFDNSVPTENRKSTGRTEPQNLKEQIAMQSVKADPLNGAKKLFDITDPTWSEDGWAKYARNVSFADKTKVEIHFVYNNTLDIYDDFKFK